MVDVGANHRDFYRYINIQKKRHQRYPPLKKEELKWGRPIGKVLDNQGQVDTFLLDFEKAFDAPLH